MLIILGKMWCEVSVTSGMPEVVNDQQNFVTSIATTCHQNVSFEFMDVIPLFSKVEDHSTVYG